MRWASSRPVRPGISMSVTSTSGCNRCTSRQALSPSATAPTTSMSVSMPSNAASAPRTIALVFGQQDADHRCGLVADMRTTLADPCGPWRRACPARLTAGGGGAGRTVATAAGANPALRMHGLDRQRRPVRHLGRQAGATRRDRFDVQAATQGLQAFAHAIQAIAGPDRAAAAVVLDLQPPVLRFAAQRDLHPAGACMPVDIGHRLAQAQGQHGFLRRRQFVRVRVDGQRHALALQ